MEPVTSTNQVSLNDDVLLYTCRFLTHRQLKPLSQVNRRLHNIVAKHLYQTSYAQLSLLTTLTPGFTPTLYSFDPSERCRIGSVVQAIEELKLAFLTRAELLNPIEIQGVRSRIYHEATVALNVAEAALELQSAKWEQGQVNINQKKALCLSSRGLFGYLRVLKLSHCLLMGDAENQKTNIQRYLAAGELSNARDLVSKRTWFNSLDYMLPVIEAYIETCRFDEAFSMMTQFKCRKTYPGLVSGLVSKLFQQRSYPWTCKFFMEISENDAEKAMDEIFSKLGDSVLCHDPEAFLCLVNGDVRKKFEVSLKLQAAFKKWEEEESANPPLSAEAIDLGHMCSTHREDLSFFLLQLLYEKKINRLTRFFQSVPNSDEHQLLLCDIIDAAIDHNWQIASKLVKFEVEGQNKTRHLTKIAMKSTKPLPVERP